MTVHEAATLFDSRADAEVVLAHLLQKNRTWVFAHPEETLTPTQETVLLAMAGRRKAGEPVAYIIGRQEFAGQTFAVGPDVLIPRPATEALTELATEWWAEPFDVVRMVDSGIAAVGFAWGRSGPTRHIADIGTGSGCIAVTLAARTAQVGIVATDISEAALHIAKGNADRLGMATRIRFLKGTLLEPLNILTEPFVVVSNPPYIPAEADVDPSAKHFEPHLALYAGEQGIDVLLPLLRAAKEHALCRGILMECREDQIATLSAEAH